MPDFNLINLGELSKPATVLIEKVSEAVGGVFRPYQTRRMAGAEADAAITQAQAQIQISDLQRRAMHRFLIEEGQKQENIESITQKALPNVASDAQPENIERDWITNFFDKGRVVSDEDMQILWSKVLAGEANKPGSYSKRTVNLLSSMDRAEADLFRSLCSFVWRLGTLTPIIYDVLNPIYTNAGINFGSLQHLDLVGLINFNDLTGFEKMLNSPHQGGGSLERSIPASYCGTPYILNLPREQTRFPIGKAVFTAPGSELALVAGSTPREDYRTYILDQWKNYNVTTGTVILTSN